MNPKPKWLDETPHHRKTIRFGKESERRVLSTLAATPTPRSGAGGMKGDGRRKAGRFLLHIEIKATARKSYALTPRVLDKLRKEAGPTRIPILAIRLGSGRTYVVTPVECFNEMTGADL